MLSLHSIEKICNNQITYHILNLFQMAEFKGDEANIIKITEIQAKFSGGDVCNFYDDSVLGILNFFFC